MSDADTAAQPQTETLAFQAEVSRLLEIVAKSLYSQKEVFLRELISNASDACDKLRYRALTEPGLLDGDAAFRITVTPDTAGRTLTIADNGIGMNRDDLVHLLGTIAKSGTLDFASRLTGDAKKDIALVGQFGVGFYSVFMVADRVDVRTRKAGEEHGWHWSSDGKGTFTVEAADGVGRGTEITLHLSEAEKDFAEPTRVRNVVKTHSDHVAIPVVLLSKDADGNPTDETVNRASALWTRPKSEITAEDYTEFYRHVSHGFDEPWLTVHYRVEGVLEYTGLLFVPSTAPFDLFHPDRKSHVKLYVRRVYVTDDAEGLLPPYLRFLRGLVDSEDLPLNISREMLQRDARLAKIKQGLTKRILSELAKKAEADETAYASFWSSFGAVLKEGLYEDTEHRDALTKLLRFHTTTAGDDLVSVDAYVGRMKPGQEAVYYLSGEDRATLAKSPHLEGFRAKGVEVLLLTDPVDEFWVGAVGTVMDRPLKSVTRAGTDLKSIHADGSETDGHDGGDEDKPAESQPAVDALIGRLKETLGEAVKDVRPSDRLTESPVVLVADDGDLDLHLERLLHKHQQIDKAARRILEINPTHPLITKLAGQVTDPLIEDMAWLLLDQARIVEGDPVPDPAAFARRLSTALVRGLA